MKHVVPPSIDEVDVAPTGCVQFCIESANPLFTIDECYECGPRGVVIEGQFNPEDGDIFTQIELAFSRFFRVIKYDFNLREDDGWMHYSARLQLK